MPKIYAYAGSLTNGSADAPPGISVFAFDDDTGALQLVQQVRGIDNPGWMAPDPHHHRLYAATERGEWNEGTLTAYNLDGATGRLAYINKQPTLGNSTCHIGLSADGRHLALANYALLPPETPPDRSIAVFARTDAGPLGPAVSSAQHAGRGPIAGRQDRSHAHCALFAPDSRTLFVVDLGLDRLLAYAVDELGRLAAAPAHDVAFEAGRGPRHAAFHPDGAALFVAHELRPGVTSLAFDGTNARPIATTELAYSEQVYPSAILPSPDGRHLYVAVRVAGEIAGFAIGADFGLAPIGRWRCGGAWPRDARLSPSGRHLLVANQDANGIAVFRRDADTGDLGLVGTTPCAAPMCVALAEG